MVLLLLTDYEKCGPEQKKIGITFKASKGSEEKLANEKMVLLSDEELVLLTTKFKCFFNKNKNGRKGET